MTRIPSGGRTVQQERIAQWVAALRSGKYEQGRSVLRQPDNSYCCLGVACDISGIGGWGEYGNYITETGGSVIALPLPVAEYFGLERSEHSMIKDSVDPVISVSGMSAIRANDKQGLSFNQIADLIEQKYLAGVA